MVNSRVKSLANPLNLSPLKTKRPAKSNVYKLMKKE